MADPTTNIVAEIMARLAAPEFRPFVMTPPDGARNEIPSRDYYTLYRLVRTNVQGPIQSKASDASR